MSQLPSTISYLPSLSHDSKKFRFDNLLYAKNSRVGTVTTIVLFSIVARYNWGGIAVRKTWHNINKSRTHFT